MEDPTPPLMRTVRELRWRIASGLSMREALRLHLESASGPLAQEHYANGGRSRPVTAQRNVLKLFVATYARL